VSASTLRQPLAVDNALLSAVVGLVVLGSIMVGSASISIAAQNMGDPFYYVLRHLGALAIGIAAGAVIFALPTELWYRGSALLLVMGLVLLLLVLVPGLGQQVNGSMRWLQLGPLRFQPSEPARLCFIIYLASYGVRHANALAASFMGSCKPLLVIGVASVLLLEEPDYGAAVVVILTSLGILFVSGSRIRDFALAVFVAALTLTVLIYVSPYRLARLIAFLDPFADPFNTGLQLANSLIAIGHGEWFGVGLGASVQKLFYLPEAHTDFVFAVLYEELGIAGSMLVIALYSLIVYRALLIGQEAIDKGMPFQGIMCIGIGLMIGLEAFINIGVNTGLLPTKGLALPLISYGRSSMVSTLVALALLLRVSFELRDARPPRNRDRRLAQ